MKAVRSAVTALVTGAVLVTGATGAAAAAPPTPAEATGLGAAYLASLVTPDGYVPTGPNPDYANTAYAVLALVSAGVGETQAAAATAYLAGHVDAFVVGTGSSDKPGALALLILVAKARGLDPTAFGSPATNLVSRLLATKQTTGADAGLFGTQDATYDGAYRQALSLLALHAAGTSDADAVAWLKAEQCADGGWMGNRPDQSAPCPAFDFSSFVGEDSNSTALAVQALTALGEVPAVDPLEFLADAQNEDGGFGFVPGFDSDANSTALAIQAIVAAGEDVAADWAAPDGTPYDALLAFQLGCEAPASKRGAFAFQPAEDGTLTANTFATVQAVPALAGDPLPIAAQPLSDDLPAFDCAVTVPSPTPSVSPVAGSPAPTAAPVPSTGGSVQPVASVRPRTAPTLPETGPVGQRPWDATGLLVTGLGLIGYGVAALLGARLTRRRAGVRAG